MAGGWFRPRCRSRRAGRGGYRSQSTTDQRKQNTASDSHRHRRGSHRGVAGAGGPKTGTRLDPRDSAAVSLGFLILLSWTVVETHSGAGPGLAERVSSAIQSGWPLAVAVSLRGTARTDPDNRGET
jgi:hypothetical protein